MGGRGFSGWGEGAGVRKFFTMKSHLIFYLFFFWGGGCGGGGGGVSSGWPINRVGRSLLI